MPFGIVAYGFVGQPFSKQLYRQQNGLGAVINERGRFEMY